LKDYNFYYWGPLLFKIKMQQEDLKKCVDLCSKKSSEVDETLAGVIKHQHYISPTHYSKIISPYLEPFYQAYRNWYGKTINQIHIRSSWVNFMIAGEFNPPHTHLNCDLSSVLFVKIPEELKEEHKKFTGTGGGPGTLSFTYGEFQTHAICSRVFFPEDGDLFIFPATLTHFVAPFLSKGERISLSANFDLK
jgi:predicted 2-oxoglutarate/Fe(II)-dependent dioxygenase YbiX